VEDHASPQAFEALRCSATPVYAPGRTLAVADHNAPLTRARMLKAARKSVDWLKEFTLPGTAIACGEVGLVLSTQRLIHAKARNFRMEASGKWARGV
jgi:homoaconitase/3-isopropylmalate dehydratase large subunit